MTETLPNAAELRQDDSAQTNAAYRERNQFPAGLAHLWPAVVVPAADFEGMFIIYLESPAGQLSWHIMPEDMELFVHVERRDTYAWDGHSTEQKYQRFDLAMRMEAQRRKAAQ